MLVCPKKNIKPDRKDTYMKTVSNKKASKKSTTDVATKATQKPNRKEVAPVKTIPQELINTRLKQLQRFYNSTQDGITLSNEKKGTTYKAKYANMNIIEKAYNNISDIESKKDLLNSIKHIARAFDLIKETWEIEYSTSTKDLHFSELQPRENFKTKKEYNEYLKQEAENIKAQEEMYLRNLNKIKEQSQKILEQQGVTTQKKDKGTE